MFMARMCCTKVMNIKALETVVVYRLKQVCQQLGFVPPMTRADYGEVERWLPASALPLFLTMSQADQQHCLRVCRGLQAHGCCEQDMLAAALLHDVGKAEGRVPFWTRPTIVLGKRFAPTWLQATLLDLDKLDHPQGRSWRRSLSYAWYHAEVGARLAATVGLSKRAVLYIQTHHQPHGPAAELYLIDEVS
jgi:hypothetical protein